MSGWYDPELSEIIAFSSTGGTANNNKGDGSPGSNTVAYSLLGWKVGKKGYNITDPTEPEPINPFLSDLIDPIYPNSGLKTFYSEVTNVKDKTVIMKFPLFEKPYAIGEWGIWCKVDATDLNPTPYPILGVVDSEFLFAVIHHSAMVKLSESIFTKKVNFKNFLP